MERASSSSCLPPQLNLPQKRLPRECIPEEDIFEKSPLISGAKRSRLELAAELMNSNNNVQLKPTKKGKLDSMRLFCVGPMSRHNIRDAAVWNAAVNGRCREVVPGSQRAPRICGSSTKHRVWWPQKLNIAQHMTPIGPPEGCSALVPASGSSLLPVPEGTSGVLVAPVSSQSERANMPPAGNKGNTGDMRENTGPVGVEKADREPDGPFGSTKPCAEKEESAEGVGRSVAKQASPKENSEALEAASGSNKGERVPPNKTGEMVESGQGCGRSDHLLPKLSLLGLSAAQKLQQTPQVGERTDRALEVGDLEAALEKALEGKRVMEVQNRVLQERVQKLEEGGRAGILRIKRLQNQVILLTRQLHSEGRMRVVGDEEDSEKVK